MLRWHHAGAAVRLRDPEMLLTSAWVSRTLDAPQDHAQMLLTAAMLQIQEHLDPMTAAGIPPG